MAVLGAALTPAAVSATTARGRRCLPAISGPLWWYDPSFARNGELSGWRDVLDAQSRVGFSILWLCGSTAALESEADTAALRDLMDLCARRHVRVILDTGASSGAWYSTLDARQELEICGESVRRMGEEFGGHPAFFAWYVPHEIYMCWGRMADYIDTLYPKLVEICKKAADAPVTISPFFILDRDKVFGDFRYNDPDEYRAYWTRLIRRSGFDIVMMQDSGEHFSYVTNEMRRPFYEAMSGACRDGRARFWGNVECSEFECPSKEEYIRRYGRIHHSKVKDAPWRPVPIDRMRDKLRIAAEYCEDIVTWGYREYCQPSLGPAAAKWYDDYLAYYRGLRTK